jgi:hypothetical protein
LAGVAKPQVSMLGHDDGEMRVRANVRIAKWTGRNERIVFSRDNQS